MLVTPRSASAWSPGLGPHLASMSRRILRPSTPPRCRSCPLNATLCFVAKRFFARFGTTSMTTVTPSPKAIVTRSRLFLRSTWRDAKPGFLEPNISNEKHDWVPLAGGQDHSHATHHLSIFCWNPGPSRGGDRDAIVGRIVEPWHVLALQECKNYMQHALLSSLCCSTATRWKRTLYL